MIDSLIIVDRNVDIITPLLTQLTYEGLLDEFFGIQNCTSMEYYHAVFFPTLSHPNSSDVTCRFLTRARVTPAHVKIDASLLTNQPPPAGGASTASASPAPAAAGPSSSTSALPAGQKRKYHLKSTDSLYSRIRDSNFSVVGPKISKEILRLDSEYKVLDNMPLYFFHVLIGSMRSPDIQLRLPLN